MYEVFPTFTFIRSNYTVAVVKFPMRGLGCQIDNIVTCHQKKNESPHILQSQKYVGTCAYSKIPGVMMTLAILITLIYYYNVVTAG